MARRQLCSRHPACGRGAVDVSDVVPVSSPAPWLARRLFPLLATAGLIVIGMATTTWGPRLAGKSAWAVPDDLWGTLVAARRMLHLDLTGLYTEPTRLVTFPGAAATSLAAAALTFASQGSWRGPLSWWAPMVAGLGLTLFFARVPLRKRRSQAAIPAPVTPHNSAATRGT
jgi:hypothetical protein